MDNPKAFPHHIVISGNDNTVNVDEETKEHLNGMDLRDYFAAKAINAMITNSDMGDIIAGSADFDAKDIPSALSKGAYEIADAMLKQRKQ